MVVVSHSSSCKGNSINTGMQSKRPLMSLMNNMYTSFYIGSLVTLNPPQWIPKRYHLVVGVAIGGFLSN